MRWKEPDRGAIKIKKWFAILPVTINKETRWLERVEVVYRAKKMIHFRDLNGWWTWEPLRFTDQEMPS